MQRALIWLVLSTVFGSAGANGYAQDARQFVQQAVNTELAKDQADHSHWPYFEDDRKADRPVKQCL